MVLVTILIIAIWLGIFAVFVKADVGGFGSTVLAPALKDVPVLSKILPDSGNITASESTETAGYTNLDDAVSRIKELEKQLDDANSKNQADAQTINDLNAQIQDLSTYKEEQAAFEEEKEKYYEEVVFSDKAPDIKEYKKFYEQVDPANAEILYKQVCEQLEQDDEIKDYAQTYSKMKPKEAAAIFDSMTDNLSLVAKILNAMDAQSRGNILGKMDSATAAKVTKIMNPSQTDSISGNNNKRKEENMADNTISPVVPNVSGGRTVSTGQKAVTQTSAQSGIDFKSYLGGRTAVQDNSTTFLKRRNSYTLNKNKTKEISIKTASKNSPTESEVKKITDDISSQIVEKVTDDLDISEDELNNAMQLLGLTAMDLLNPANLSALYCEVTGNASDPQALVLNADFTALFNDVSQVASENDAQLDLLSQLTASDDGEILDADIVSSADTTEKTVDSSYDDTAASGQNITTLLMKLLRYMMAVHRTVLTKTRTKALLQAKQAMVLHQMKIQKRLSQSLRLTVALMIQVSACCIMMMTHTQTIQYFMHLSANS